MFFKYDFLRKKSKVFFKKFFIFYILCKEDCVMFLIRFLLNLVVMLSFLRRLYFLFWVLSFVL